MTALRIDLAQVFQSHFGHQRPPAIPSFAGRDAPRPKPRYSAM